MPNRIRQTKSTCKKTDGFGLFILIGLFVGLSLAPYSASAAICCKCARPEAPKEVVCLKTVKTTCGDIDQQKLGVVCTGTLTEAQCKTVDDKGICFENPVDVDSVEQIRAEQEATAAIQSGPVTRITAPTLNIPIPYLQFATNIVERGGFILIPFLAQYISAFYRALFGISIIAAAVMVMYGGFKYLVASTGANVESGKQIIVDALVGLVLLLGAYAVLAAVNPGTLTPAAIRVSTIRYQPYFEEQEGNDPASQPGANERTVTVPPTPGGTATGGTYKVPRAVCSGVECKKLCNGKYPIPNLPPAPEGVARSGDLAVIPNRPGLEGKGGKLRPEAVEALAAAGQAAQKWSGGPYIIQVVSAARSFEEQVAIACGAFAAGEDSKVGNTIAQPGGSKHGIGVAVDVVLKKGGKYLTTCCTSATQTKTMTKANAEILFEIMASVGWVRLCNEAWHFELGTKGVPCRCDTFKWPPTC